MKDNGIQSLAIGLVERGDTINGRLKSSKTWSEKDIDMIWKTNSALKGLTNKSIGIDYLNLSETEMSE